MMSSKQVIGVIHLPRLPSVLVKPQHSLEEVVERAVREARILEGLGFAGAIVENYGDIPYPKRVRDPLTIASIAIIVREVVKSTNLKVGVNILRNSGREAYSVALASGAKFIRINALVEAIVSDSGIIEPEAPRLAPLIANYPGVEVYADILVKHASSLRFSLGLIESGQSVGKGSAEEHLRGLVEDYVERGRASALIVTGLRTGDLPPLKLVELVKKFSSVPVLVGSGVTADNIKSVLEKCDGVIVGSFVRREGRAGADLDVGRARALIEAAK